MEGLAVDEFRNADDDGDAVGGFGDALQLGPGVEEELALEEEVLRRVAGEGQFREGDEVGLLFLCLADERKHPLGVALEVADGGVHLAEGYADGPHESPHNADSGNGGCALAVLTCQRVQARRKGYMPERRRRLAERRAAMRAFSPLERKKRRSLWALRMPLRVTAARNRDTIASGGSPSLISTYAMNAPCACAARE